jgi:hypothetical protein
VHFAPQPVVSYLSSDSGAALITWYGSEVYQLFTADCRNTVRKAPHLHVTTVNWNGVDPAQESLLGWEHFFIIYSGAQTLRMMQTPWAENASGST